MANESVMRCYPIPGTILKEWVIPAKEYSALTIRQGQTLRFVDIEGKQVPDLVCFNERDLTEQLNMGNSLLLNKRRELRQGDVLYSVSCKFDDDHRRLLQGRKLRLRPHVQRGAEPYPLRGARYTQLP